MMTSGSSKHLGSYHDLPRFPSSAVGGGAGVAGAAGGPGWTSLGLQRLLLAVVALVLLPSIIFAFVNLNSTSAIRSQQQHNHRQVASSPALVQFLPSNGPELVPTYEYVDEAEYVWQIPSDPAPKGVLFLAHGCQCRSTFFWDKHDRCKNCTGMPEERTLVLHALARGYAVIAISSSGECWSYSADTNKVIRALSTWIAGKGLKGLPVFGLGASSGGHFISVLALHFKFQSLVIEISAGRFEAMDFDSTYPPTLFVHMPKDKKLASRVSEARELLGSKGVRTDEILCSELKVTPHFFSERIPDLNKDISEKVVATLHQYGYLTPGHNGGYYMKRDGRQSGWKMALRKANVMPYDARLKWERPLEEEMNLAYAYHEFTSLPALYIFDWFESASPSAGEI